jgi:ABC-type nickel/cobalt efflux system permease component RcnA
MTRVLALAGLLLLGATLAVTPAAAQVGPPPGRPAAPGLGIRPEGGGAEAQPPWLRGFLGRVNTAQRQLNQALSRELRRLRQGEVAGAALGVAWIAFLYGVLHAVGPGHGKLVVSSLFLARDARLGSAVAISGAVSLLQTVSAVAIVSVAALAMGRGGLDVLRDSRRVELISYGLIAVIGLLMLGTAIRDVWAHRPGGGASARPDRPAAPVGHGTSSSGLVVATGLTPCASAVIILLFALGQGVFLVGVAAALVMAVGMALTVSLVGILAVLARRGTVRAAATSGGVVHWVKGALGVLGATAIAALGLILLLGAWTGA